MFFSSLATTALIDADALNSAMGIPTWALVLAAIGPFGIVGSGFLFGGDRGTRDRPVLLLAGLAVLASGIGCIYTSAVQVPDSAAVTKEAATKAYPGLTFSKADLDCIRTVVRHDETCTATRKADGGYAKLEYAIFDGKVVITSPTGSQVTTDEDVNVAR